MIAAKEFDIIKGGHLIARLRPADGSAMASHPAGPFDVAAEPARATTRDALLTGLLVVYPAFAAIAAIIEGLLLSGAAGA
jgi:hypothetical protein